MPFTHEQFLDIFGAYNTALWPAAAVLWIATLGVMLAFYRRGAPMSRAVALLLTIHWAWSGVVYHGMYFRTINPAATLFAALFIIEAMLLLWRGMASPGLQFEMGASSWSLVGMVLVGYSLVYPGLGLLLGLTYPRLPLFAVPCPTTILTAGVLMSAPPRNVRWLAVIPILWAAIGGSAAVMFAIRADFALLVAGVLLLVFITRSLFPPSRTTT